MRLEIFKKYLVKSNHYQFILYEKRKGKPFEAEVLEKGENYGNFYPPTYHSTFDSVLRRIKQSELLNSRVKNLDDLAKALKEIDKKIEDIGKKFM